MLPKSQKAWMVVRRGNPSKALEMQTSLPVPTTLEPGECLVKIKAAALNPVGYKLMKFLPDWLSSKPYVAELDLSGVVVKQNDTEFKQDDEVFGWVFDLNKKTRQGALAQYIQIPSAYITKKPSNISFQEASGLALAGMTAYAMLVDVVKVESGQSIFVNGGSTSVGRYAIEIAKAMGCKVVASCSTKSMERVKGYGADEVIDYSTSSVHSQLSSQPPTPRFHAILECYGSPSPSLYLNSTNYLAPSGIFVSVGPQPHSVGDFFAILRGLYEGFMRPVWLGGMKARYKLFGLSFNKKEYLNELANLVSEGKIKPLVDSVYTFDDVLKAYDRIMTGKAVGKVVVDIDHDEE